MCPLSLRNTSQFQSFRHLFLLDPPLNLVVETSGTSNVCVATGEIDILVATVGMEAKNIEMEPILVKLPCGVATEEKRADETDA